jgi:ribonuclease III
VSDEPDLGDLEARLGWPFVTRDRLLRALTHPSYAHEHPPTPSNETLAFLGDAVLGLVVAELVWQRGPDEGPGALTTERAALVSAASLAGWAARLDLGAWLRLGRGEEMGGGGGPRSRCWPPRSRRSWPGSTSRAGSIPCAGWWPGWERSEPVVT